MLNIITALSHMIFWATPLFMCYALYDSPSQMICYAMATAILAGLGYWARMKINKMWVFVIGHLAVVILGGGLIFLFPIKTWYIAFLILLAAWSMVLRCLTLLERFDEPSSLYVGFAVAFYFLLWILEANKFTQGISLGAALLLFLIKLLYDNLQSADWFMEVRNLSEDSDAKKASRISKQISYLYTGGIGIILGLFAFVSMDGVWQAIKAGVRRLLIAFLSLFSWEEPQVQEEEMAEKGEQALGMFTEMMEEGEKPLLLLVFDKIVPVVTTMAIVALVIWGIVTFMKKMYGGFYKTRMQAEDRLEVEKLKADKWTARGRRKENEGHTENNASRRIRKMYKKNMSKSGEKNLREFPYMTPGEQVQRREETYDFKGDSGEVRELYEKARYGKDAVTDSDVEKMRGIL